MIVIIIVLVKFTRKKLIKQLSFSAIATTKFLFKRCFLLPGELLKDNNTYINAFNKVHVLMHRLLLLIYFIVHSYEGCSICIVYCTTAR